MRYLIKVDMPIDPVYMAVHDPKFEERMQSLLQEMKAEAAYFVTENGHRGGYIVVNIDDVSADEASQMVAIAKPFLLWLKADVEFIPVVLPQDLVKKGPAVAATRN